MSDVSASPRQAPTLRSRPNDVGLHVGCEPLRGRSREKSNGVAAAIVSDVLFIHHHKIFIG
jgi:hypothetical protein